MLNQSGMLTQGFTLHPMDENLSLHPSEQRSLTGDPGPLRSAQDDRRGRDY
jgi:hypothetical protein